MSCSLMVFYLLWMMYRGFMMELRSLLSLFVGCGPDYAVISAYGQMVNLTAAGSLRQAGRILLF